MLRVDALQNRAEATPSAIYRTPLSRADAKAEECFEVLRHRQMIEYRSDGVLVAQGTLVNQ